jgi:hypothetical protein
VNGQPWGSPQGVEIAVRAHHRLKYISLRGRLELI